jgi:hypothetical protein
MLPQANEPEKEYNPLHDWRIWLACILVAVLAVMMILAGGDGEKTVDQIAKEQALVRDRSLASQAVAEPASPCQSGEVLVSISNINQCVTKANSENLPIAPTQSNDTIFGYMNDLFGSSYITIAVGILLIYFLFIKRRKRGRIFE